MLGGFWFQDRGLGVSHRSLYNYQYYSLGFVIIPCEDLYTVHHPEAWTTNPLNPTSPTVDDRHAAFLSGLGFREVPLLNYGKTQYTPQCAKASQALIIRCPPRMLRVWVRGLGLGLRIALPLKLDLPCIPKPYELVGYDRLIIGLKR